MKKPFAPPKEERKGGEKFTNDLPAASKSKEEKKKRNLDAPFDRTGREKREIELSPFYKRVKGKRRRESGRDGDSGKGGSDARNNVGSAPRWDGVFCKGGEKNPISHPNKKALSPGREGGGDGCE